MRHFREIARFFSRRIGKSRKGYDIMELLIALLITGLFALAAMRWGCDSTEPFDSPEWEKRLAPPFVGKSQASLRHNSLA
jgi:hypothetical protein